MTVIITPIEPVANVFLFFNLEHTDFGDFAENQNRFKCQQKLFGEEFRDVTLNAARWRNRLIRTRPWNVSSFDRDRVQRLSDECKLEENDVIGMTQKLVSSGFRFNTECLKYWMLASHSKLSMCYHLSVSFNDKWKQIKNLWRYSTVYLKMIEQKS